MQRCHLRNDLVVKKRGSQRNECVRGNWVRPAGRLGRRGTPSSNTTAAVELLSLLWAQFSWILPKKLLGIVKPYLAVVATCLVRDFHKVSYSVSVMQSSLCTTWKICAPPSAFDGDAKHDDHDDVRIGLWTDRTNGFWMMSAGFCEFSLVVCFCEYHTW